MDKTLILLGFEYIIRLLVLALGGAFMSFVRKYQLEKWVKIGVNAAEQMFEANLINIPKKEYVIQFINNKFRLKVNENELNALIEAAVHEMNMIKELNSNPKHVVNVR